VFERRLCRRKLRGAGVATPGPQDKALNAREHGRAIARAPVL